MDYKEVLKQLEYEALLIIDDVKRTDNKKEEYNKLINNLSKITKMIDTYKKLIIKEEINNKNKIFNVADKNNNTFVIQSSRGTGKTRYLIIKSNELNIPILCSGLANCEYIARLADEMGVKIPKPVIINDFMKSYNYKEVLIDDIDCVFHRIFNVKIKGMTITTDERDKRLD